MIIKITCRECHGAFKADIPAECWDWYQDGIPIEIAFKGIPEDSVNLVVTKMCPPCVTESATFDI